MNMRSLFVLMWYAPAPFVYETSYGGAEQAPAGRSVLRFSTKAQALALGRLLAKGSPSVTYSVYRLGDGEMSLEELQQEARSRNLGTSANIYELVTWLRMNDIARRNSAANEAALAESIYGPAQQCDVGTPPDQTGPCADFLTTLSAGGCSVHAVS